jgi:hypothetical protein
MHCHVEAANIHRRGLRQMVKLRGGLSELGFNGFLAHLILLCVFFISLSPFLFLATLKFNIKEMASS